MSVIGLIKKNLLKKGYPGKEVIFLKGNSVCEGEWFFKVSDGEKRVMLDESSDFFGKTDFDQENFIGGNREYVDECLDALPTLKSTGAK